MKNFQQQSLTRMAISYGDTLPYAAFTLTLPEILQQAAGKTTGIVYHRQNNTAEGQSYAQLLAEAAKILTGLRQQSLQSQSSI